MTKEEIEQKIKEADKAYYTDGTSTLSDYEYDSLKRSLREIDPDNELLKALGEDHTDGFAKVKHEARMLSLDKIQAGKDADSEYEDIRNWVLIKRDALGGEELLLVEPKVDGMSAEALYENGKLISVSTRGNGDEGDDITRNVRSCFPAEITGSWIPSRFVIRGELYISQQEFLRINKVQQENEKPIFANARNLCAGTVKSKETVTDRQISFVCHGYKDLSGDGGVSTLYEAYSHLTTECRIACPDICTKITIDSLLHGNLKDLLKQIDNSRSEFPYCIDGAVIKVDRLGTQNRMGETEHHPRWAVAYKYKPEVKKTKINKIIWQLGAKTGKATPVAEVEPVIIDGTIVSRASLANAGQMAFKGIHEGCTILLEKANEIIPHVVEVLDPIEVILEPTMACPSCGSTMPLVEGEAANTANYICENSLCPEKVTAALQQAFGTNGLNVLGIGPEYCKAFVEKFGACSVMAIIALQQADYPDILSPLQKANLYAELQQARTAPLHRWIAACQFPGVAMGTAKKIAQRCQDWLTFVRKVTEQDKEGLGVTDRIMTILHDGMTTRHLDTVMNHILGINPISDCFVDQSGPKPLTGLNFVVTGVFDAGRKHIEEMIPQYGGSLKSAVSKKTHYLVAGQDVGRTKIDKAAACGTKVISEKEFFELISSAEE